MFRVRLSSASHGSVFVHTSCVTRSIGRLQPLCTSRSGFCGIPLSTSHTTNGWFTHSSSCPKHPSLYPYSLQSRPLTLLSQPPVGQLTPNSSDLPLPNDPQPINELEPSEEKDEDGEEQENEDGEEDATEDDAEDDATDAAADEKIVKAELELQDHERAKPPAISNMLSVIGEELHAEEEEEEEKKLNSAVDEKEDAAPEADTDAVAGDEKMATQRSDLTWDQRQAKHRARIWHLHRARDYGEVVRLCDSFMDLPFKFREIVWGSQQVTYQYLHSLAQLNQYHLILKVTKKRTMIYESPECVEILASACMREPTKANTEELYRQLKKRDQQRMEVEMNDTNKEVIPAPTSTTTSALPTIPQRMITENVANQLMKAFLLAGRPQLAYQLWSYVVLGKDDPEYRPWLPNNQPQQPHPYKTFSYRLQSQTSHGLIMFMLEEHDSLIQSKSLATSGKTHEEYLVHAFQMFLQTSFIDHVVDTTLLMRIFNATLRTVALPYPARLSRPAFKRHGWLLVQIYRFILHHNETVVKEEQRHKAQQQEQGALVSSSSSVITPTINNHTHTTSSSFTDSPWSHMAHRSFIPLTWKYHFQPLIRFCLTEITYRRVHLKSSTTTNAEKHDFEPFQLLSIVLYDIRMTYPDYSHLREDEQLSSEQLLELDQLESSERAEQRELDDRRAYQQQHPDSSSAAESGLFIPLDRYVPISPLRVLDDATCLCILRVFLRSRRYMGNITRLYASIPALKRYDTLRQEFINQVSAYIMDHHWVDSWNNQTVISLGSLLKPLHLEPKIHAWTKAQQLVQSSHHQRITTDDMNEEDAEAEMMNLPPATTAQLFRPIGEGVFLHPEPLNRYSTLSLFLRMEAAMKQHTRAFALFNDFYTRYRVQPKLVDYETIIRVASKEPNGLPILLAIHRALDDPSIQTGRSVGTDLLVMDSIYQLMQPRLPASTNTAIAAGSPSSSNSSTTDLWTYGNWSVDQLKPIHMIMNCWFRSRTTVNHNRHIDSLIESNNRPQLMEILHVILISMSWMSQYSDQNFLNLLWAIETYHKIAHHLDPSVPLGEIPIQQLPYAGQSTDDWNGPLIWSELQPTDVLIVRTDPVALWLLPRPLAASWRKQTPQFQPSVQSVTVPKDSSEGDQVATVTKKKTTKKKVKSTSSSTTPSPSPKLPPSPSPLSPIAAATVVQPDALPTSISATLNALRSGLAARRRVAAHHPTITKHAPTTATTTTNTKPNNHPTTTKSTSKTPVKSPSVFTSRVPIKVKSTTASAVSSKGKLTPKTKPITTPASGMQSMPQQRLVEISSSAAAPVKVEAPQPTATTSTEQNMEKEA